MGILILGLVIFLGMHSVRIIADGGRTALRSRIGVGPWMLVYSALSLLGLWMLMRGYNLARLEPVPLWTPPVATRHLAGLLTLVAFILLAATYVPRNAIKARVHHPMVLGVALWALAHLLANGSLADLILFGSFLVWSVLSFLSARRRDRISGTVYAGTAGNAAIAVVIGVAAWAAFAFWLHAAAIGVRPFY
jgi:uncharacterized membrane protein